MSNVRGKPTTLATLTALASSGFKAPQLRAQRDSTILVFKVDCWISGIVIRDALERQGWNVTEIPS